MAILQDLRFAIRSLGRTPGFTVAAVASLPVGIATATTVFSLVDAAILRPPPFAEPNRLTVAQHHPAHSRGGRATAPLVVAPFSAARTRPALLRRHRLELERGPHHDRHG